MAAWHRLGKEDVANVPMTWRSDPVLRTRAASFAVQARQKRCHYSYCSAGSRGASVTGFYARAKGATHHKPAEIAAASMLSRVAPYAMADVAPEDDAAADHESDVVQQERAAVAAPPAGGDDGAVQRQ